MTLHASRSTHHTLQGPSRSPRSGGAAKQLVILLHGWGADGPNLIDLADLFGQVLPDAQFVAPNAPFPCEANPFGYQWFSLVDRQPQHMLQGVTEAAGILNTFIDEQLKALKLDNSKLALVGFSQGTMTALHVALRRSPQIACVVGYSGSLIAPDELAKGISARPPVCLIHGDADDVVPYVSMQMAEQALRQYGVDVSAHTREYLSHSIDMDGIRIAAEFLKNKLV
ncbi:MAG: alpha/beta hydrolase [Alphaproteobacteria bacterium]